MQGLVPQRAGRHFRRKPLYGTAMFAVAVNGFMPMAALAAGVNDNHTTTPIRHVIVIIGENRSFDHVFATYQPLNKGETVFNLLSEGIVNADGTPGPHYSAATQNQAKDMPPALYELNPTSAGAYRNLPPPITPRGGFLNGVAPFSTVKEAKNYENGLPDSYYKYLTTGSIPASLLGKVDTRIRYDGKDVNHLPPGPYQLTPSVPYDAYASSPAHRFYQMWQQLDCHAASGTPTCANDLFAWVEATVGSGSNGKPPPPGFKYKEGATALGFYNVQQGDAPYLKSLADTYAMSDNYHQAVSGGTGANHIMLGTGDAIWFSDGNGNPKKPPQGPISAGPNSGTVAEIEDPDPLPGTNNWYTEDGYGGGSRGKPSYGGGSYSNCSDTTQPGVPAIVDFLAAIHVNPNCQSGHFYILNNYNPGYYGNGLNAYHDIANPHNAVFTVPPSSVPNIGDDLWTHLISFAYFGDQFNAYLASPYNNFVTRNNTYCNICNFFQYSISIMTNPVERRLALQDTIALYKDLETGNLPAVSFVKPSGYDDGHPGSSKLDLFEGFVKKIVDMTKANRKLWAETAIFVTVDEGGGYYDSGYVQQLDFFGDGTRIPLIVVSPFSKGGHISHTYADHVSILKFIEANWNIPPVSSRSRDNLPNPVTGTNPYKPTNGPAIGNLMDLFNFKS
jgi:phospholipase C